MEERATGLILRTRPLTETSLIIHWLTGPLGRVATVAKGARRPKSPFRGKLDLFHLAQFNFNRSRRSDLHVLREVSVIESFPAFRSDYQLLSQAAYAAKLLEKTTEPESPLETGFTLFLDFLRSLHDPTSSEVLLLAWQCRWLEDLGLSPASARATPKARQLIHRLLSDSWEELARLKLQPGDLRELDHLFQHLLQDHLGFAPPARQQR